MDLRIGHGYDRHRLVEGRPLVLGGVRFEHERGLEGHSDADALVHAICDALLGAAALGDLGTHFSDRDPAQEGRDSLEILAEVVALVHGEGYRVVNVDCTVVADAPRLAPRVRAMREEISRTLQIELGRVSVKATRGEKVGPEGREEAISAQAVALLEREVHP